MYICAFLKLVPDLITSALNLKIEGCWEAERGSSSSFWMSELRGLAKSLNAWVLAERGSQIVQLAILMIEFWSTQTRFSRSVYRPKYQVWYEAVPSLAHVTACYSRRAPVSSNWMSHSKQLSSLIQVCKIVVAFSGRHSGREIACSHKI